MRLRHMKTDDVDVTFRQRCGRKFRGNVRKLECQSCIVCSKLQAFVLYEVLCACFSTHSVSFLVSPFVQLKCKSKMAARFFFQW